MDDGTSWTASALFSPSKARAQQAQAKDWASVDAWLAKKYGSKHLEFERNEETLQVLLQLAMLNEDADEQRSLTERVEKASSTAISKRGTSDEQDIHYAILDKLDGTGYDSLNALAESLVHLQASGIPQLAGKGYQLQNDRFDLLEHMRHIEGEQSALAREESRLRRILDELSNNAFQPPTDVAASTTEWTRNTKHLKAKVAEYDERLLATHRSEAESPNIGDIAKQVTDLAALRERVRNLESEGKHFQNLPVDPTIARKRLKVEREELQRLVAKRDDLFEKMGNKGR